MDNYNYHKGMNGIIQELTGLLKTKNIGTIYLMTANLSHAKTHFKKAFKIYEKIWADEPEMIEAKYREIQELYPQIGFLHWKKSIRSFNKISIIYGGQLARRYIQLFVK
ncbi:hypothetical protein M5E86_11170 [Blautia wexlerae]|nr:hypothetical protein M5E86_11170 [Blautia wexlerae]